LLPTQSRVCERFVDAPRDSCVVFVNGIAFR
jgi:hypothetical protein